MIAVAPQVFAIMAQSNLEGIENAIKSKFPNDYLQLGTLGQWLLAAGGTANELCDTLGISDGSPGTAIVLPIGSYYGRASTSIWEWINSRVGVGRG